MGVEGPLTKLLQEIFSFDELERFSRHVLRERGLDPPILGSGVPLARACFELVSWLARTGNLDHALFADLRRERPARVREIDQVERGLGAPAGATLLHPWITIASAAVVATAIAVAAVCSAPTRTVTPARDALPIRPQPEASTSPPSSHIVPVERTAVPPALLTRVARSRPSSPRPPSTPPSTPPADHRPPEPGEPEKVPVREPSPPLASLAPDLELTAADRCRAEAMQSDRLYVQLEVDPTRVIVSGSPSPNLTRCVESAVRRFVAAHEFARPAGPIDLTIKFGGG